MRMYSMYAESKNWKIDILSSNPTDIGGYKEVSFSIEGQAHTADLNLKAVYTVFREFRKQNQAEEFILLPLR